MAGRPLAQAVAWECLAAQGHQARTEEAQAPRRGPAKGPLRPCRAASLPMATSRPWLQMVWGPAPGSAAAMLLELR